MNILLNLKSFFLPVLVRLFNKILDAGTFPRSWSIGVIIPLLKKGNTNDVNNYRGITLVSNLAKIFTTVLNYRLLRWSDDNGIISDAQFGFKPGHSTTDAIFALTSLVSLYLKKKKKLYCCFVDYRKAFDSVNRNKLLYKLATNGVTGKLLSIIKHIYCELKSCVRYKSELSNYFSSTTGLMQGEALSPFLFSLYINDFEMDFIRSCCEPVDFRDLSLFLLMYADDTVLIANSRESLQGMLNQLYQFSNDWNIGVNTDKTKIVVFRHAGRMCKNDFWTYDQKHVEVVNCFNYLGINLNFNGNFNVTQKTIAMQGRKCMFGILKLCNETYLNIETKLSIFDTYVSSVLNYGSEIWGFHSGDEIERVHTNFCKRILKVKKCTSNFMVYSELGRLPMSIIRKLRIIKYWLKLIKTENCILRNVYEEMVSQLIPNTWCFNVRELLVSLGMHEVWLSQNVANTNVFLKIVKQRLSDFFIQERDAFFE